MSLATNIKQLFAPTVLTTSAATMTTVPSTPSTTVLLNGRVRLTNTSNAIHTATVYAVPNAGSASAANCIANAESIAPNSHLDLDIPQMAAGDFLQALADAATSITISCLAGTFIAQ